jgi:hypothetical protein
MPALFSTMSTLPNSFGGGLEHPPGLVEVDGVVSGDHGLTPGLLDGLGGFVRRIGVHVVHHDGGALPGEKLGGGPADPTARTGDHGDLAVESAHVRFSFEAAYEAGRAIPRYRSDSGPCKRLSGARATVFDVSVTEA